MKTIGKMADDDEIDILGDFSFNSCLAQNNQGIPSCSSREDTVHPQWLLDSTATSWYDNEREKRAKYGPSRKLSGDSTRLKHQRVRHSSWSQNERDLLGKEMAKYGRNFHKISQTIKTKSAAEIQALIEAEYGVNLDTPSMGLAKSEDQDDIPSVVQEEIVTDDSSTNVLSLVTTASPTIAIPKKPFRKKNNNISHKSLLKPDALQKSDLVVNPSEIYYEDELVLGSTESVGSTIDSSDVVVKSKGKQRKIKAVKKIGNHRRKVSFKATTSKELLKSPPGRQRNDSGVSEESAKSPQLQIVLGSGQALHVSEGEQVIKIEKKKDTESDSDIEVDIDSDSEKPVKREQIKSESSSTTTEGEAPIAVPLDALGLPPKRQKKLVLHGEGGYTIAHTAAGDVLQRAAPRRATPRIRPPQLIPCAFYNDECPAPYSVVLCVSALLVMDAQAHGSRAEVMGLLGGALCGAELRLQAYRAARAAAGHTHCDMDPVSQAEAGAWLRGLGLLVVGWHHSHPYFPPSPSLQDLRSQAALQGALEPCVALVTSQQWPPGRTYSQYRCFRVESDLESEPTGRQLRVRLSADVSARSAPALLQQLRQELRHRSVDHVCPQAKLTYLEKFISSMTHHMQAAGYAQDAPVLALLVDGLRDTFR